MTREERVRPSMDREDAALDATLVADIRQMIADARVGIATAINATLTLLFWRIGKRIFDGVLHGGRAEYGGRTLAALAAELTGEFGPSFGEKNLRNMVRLPRSSPMSRLSTH